LPADAEPERVAEGATAEAPNVGPRALQLTTISMDMGRAISASSVTDPSRLTRPITRAVVCAAAVDG